MFGSFIVFFLYSFFFFSYEIWRTCMWPCLIPFIPHWQLHAHRRKSHKNIFGFFLILSKEQQQRIRWISLYKLCSVGRVILNGCCRHTHTHNREACWSTIIMQLSTWVLKAKMLSTSKCSFQNTQTKMIKPEMRWNEQIIKMHKRIQADRATIVVLLSVLVWLLKIKDN